MSEDQQRKTIGDLTVTIERSQCIGSGNCAKVAPQLFELDDSNIVTFAADAGQVDRLRVIEACDVCPVDALLVHDAAGKRVVPGEQG